MSRVSYTWLLFDLDNTLMDFNQASHISFHRAMQTLGLPRHKIDYAEYNRHNYRVWHEFELGEIDALTLRAKRFQLYFDAVDHSGSDPLIGNRLYLEGLVDHPIMLEGARELIHDAKQHYRLAVITNGLKEVQRPRLRSAGIYDLFDTIVVSDEIGHAKPHPEYFDHVFIESKDIDHRNALVIGDSLKSDIQGAHRYGIDSCWFNPHRVSADHRYHATHEVHSIDGIRSLLKL